MSGTLKERSSGLLIPSASTSRSREHDGGKVLKCTVPGCGATFGRDQHEKWVRHVRNCAEAHDDEIQAEAAKRRSSYFTDVADRELYDHLRKGGN